MKNLENGIKKATLVLAIALVSFTTAEAQQHIINVNDARFTRPLIEKLVKEYQKEDPQFKAVVVSGNTNADVTVSISSDDKDDAETVAHYFILPVANADNSLLGEKKVQKGVTKKIGRRIFVEKSYDDYLDDGDKKELPGTVYTLGGKHSTTTKLLANSLDVDVKNLRGKKVIGREENVVSVLKNRKDAVSAVVASLVYDPSTRKPVQGIAVLPADLDGNGRVSDEERKALTDIDNLTEFVENHGRTSLPVGSIRINSKDNDVNAFVEWASTVGQNYVRSLGYLKVNTQYLAQK